ncbi:E3 ubiquitin-protein ligase makorin [Microdochium nivale]|nr:E3 ubiquitin-protein ligase makorin [Microdochium nivale]
MPALLTSRAGAAPHSSSLLSPNHRRHSDRAAAHQPSSSHGLTLSQPSAMAEFRHGRSSSVKIAAAEATNPAATTSQQGGRERFEGPRSPPNTSHVPCKFFRQGACQAGSACPFSHDLGHAAETVCKYFAKGNCKFGPKCANAHILADGRRINYGKNGISIAPALHLGNRVNPAAYNSSNQSALTHSFLRADAAPSYADIYGFPPGSVDGYQDVDGHSGIDSGVPTIDEPFSRTDSQYGSPRDDDISRFGMGLSSFAAAKGLSVLDAPLPASFDSNGVSHAARHPAGPFPSSVPSQFGIESPSPSLIVQRDGRTTDALTLLHHSAFGAADRITSTITPSSPPSHTPDEYFGRRQMHSSRFAKPKLLSSSAPRSNIDRDWEPDFSFFEEDYVPDNLRDLLTPAEKARRGSRAAEDEVNSRSPAMTGLSTPVGEGSALKFGSPLASSPGRWGPSSFHRQMEDPEARRQAAAASAGAFGHVGSPLRQPSLSSSMSHLHNGRSGSTEGAGALAQQLQRTRIDGTGGESPRLHPHSHLARPSNGRSNERHVSSSSISSSARYTTPIGEEEGEFVFAMDEDGDRDSTIRARKRTSGVGTAASIWGTSYAGVAASGANKKNDSASRVSTAGSGR